VSKGDYLTTFIVPKVEKIRSLNLADPQGPTCASSGKTLPLHYAIPHINVFRVVEEQTVIISVSSINVFVLVKEKSVSCEELN
jgi:hypothetical protein